MFCVKLTKSVYFMRHLVRLDIGNTAYKISEWSPALFALVQISQVYLVKVKFNLMNAKFKFK